MALIYEKIKRNPQRIYYSETFEKNNLTIVLSILYTKEKEVIPTYISKYNLTREKQIINETFLNERKEGCKGKSEKRVAKSEGRR